MEGPIALGFGEATHVDGGRLHGDRIDGAVMQPTRLFEDNQAAGDWVSRRLDNALKVGLTFDTRDFEPDPSSGVMLQAVGRISSERLVGVQLPAAHLSARAIIISWGYVGRSSWPDDSLRHAICNIPFREIE